MTPLDPLSAALGPWQNFYMLTGAAAATLTGLMFVAVTFGASLVTSETSATARAFLDPTFRHFVQVLFVACLATVPILDAAVFGVGLMAIGGARIAGLSWVYLRYREAHRKKGDIELSDWLSGIVLPLACHVSLFAAGLGFLRSHPACLAGLAIAQMGILFIGVYGAWELLVWMAVAVSGRRDGATGEEKGRRNEASS